MGLCGFNRARRSEEQRLAKEIEEKNNKILEQNKTKKIRKTSKKQVNTIE